MGVETAAVVAVAGLSAANGIMTARDEKKQAKYQNAAIRKAVTQKVNIKRKETSQTIAAQKTGYLKSGVELVGSAADVLYDTFSTSEKDINAMINDANTQMANNTRVAKSNARAALMEGIIGAGKTLVSSGMLSSAGTPPVYDVTGTAGVGSNVNMTNASYVG